MSEIPAKLLSIVVPVYNERKTIDNVVSKLLRMRLPYGWNKQIILIDDNSNDGTTDALKKYQKDAEIIYRTENGGKGAALKTGFQSVKGDYVIVQDADNEYDPADISKLLVPIDEGKAEVVFGSRVLGKNNVPFNRVYFYGGLMITKIFNLLFRTRITDLATCYKVFPKKYIPDLIKMSSDNFVFDVVEMSFVLLRKVKKIYEVPIGYVSRHRDEGKKMNWRHGYWCFTRILSLFITEKTRSVFRILGLCYARCSRFINRHDYLRYLLVFSLFFLVFFLIYFNVSTLSSADDHFFHFRFAEQMRQHGFFESFQNFKSIYFSEMADGNDYFVYYNFLFYLVILPFTYLDPLYLGIKLYAVFAISLAFTALYWCIGKINVRNPFIWTLVIMSISNNATIWRFLLSRPYALAPTLLLLLLIFLYKRSYVGIFLVSFVYLFWHSATFFMPLMVVSVYFIIEWFYREQRDWKLVIISFLGTAIALLLTYLVSSGLLLYVRDIIFGTYWDTILGKKVHISEGGELYPIDFFAFIQANSLIFAVFITSISVDIFSYFAFKFKSVSDQEYFLGLDKRRRHLQTTILVLTILLFLGTVAASARFGDYFTMFAGLYIALSFDYTLRVIKISGSAVMVRGITTGLAIVLAYLFVSNMLFLQDRLAKGAHPTISFQIGMWLNHNTKKGDVIFNLNWSWFPPLYYYSPERNYFSGLEPRFFYMYNPRMYWTATHIANEGYVCDEEKCPKQDEEKAAAVVFASTTLEWAKKQGKDIADLLRNEFHSEIVISNDDYTHANYVFRNSGQFEQVLYNKDYGSYIFRLKKAYAK